MADKIVGLDLANNPERRAVIMRLLAEPPIKLADWQLRFAERLFDAQDRGNRLVLTHDLRGGYVWQEVPGV